MFCYQCEQTQADSRVQGCSGARGNCGKDEQTSDLQDILIYQIRGIARYASVLSGFMTVEKKVDDFIQHGLFTTLTNVNFDAKVFVDLIQQASSLMNELRNLCQRQAVDSPLLVEGPAAFRPAGSEAGLMPQAAEASIDPSRFSNPDAHGLFMLILYGMKGVCAYSWHARQLGYSEPEIDRDIIRFLADLSEQDQDVEGLLTRSLAVGELNLRVMDLLDRANTGSFGHPEVTRVSLAPKPGKAILISGHDLHDLRQLLEQTRGTGIQVYTHGEMLPAHSYPGLKKYDHLAGNYGGAWQNQMLEFSQFPGPIVMTSNCLIKPSSYYADRIYTTGPVGWPGIHHVQHGDYSPVIEQALAMEGFAESGEEQFITTGFGHNTVMSVAGDVIEAVKSGQIRHFFVIGGCDGAKPGRNYYTELAEQTPSDTIMLTLGCAKYRFNKQEFGDIAGIPRLLDMGQCNDAHSAIQVALALAEAFDCELNDLPLSLMISWFEQKATAVLLSLLHAGVRGIHLGPTLPVFLTPGLQAVLSERFDIRSNHSPEEDLRQAMGAH